MNKLKLIIGALVIACAAFIYMNKTSTDNVLRVSSEGNYAPWNATDSDGNLIGFEIDLANKICEKIKKKCVFVKQDWDGVIPALINNKFDVIMACMIITEKRRKSIDFSKAYANSGTVVASINLKKMNSLDDMRKGLLDKTIGVQIGTVSAIFSQAEYGDTGIATIRTYSTQEEMNLDLLAGRIDAGMNDLTIWLDLQKKQPNVKIVSPILTGTDSPEFGEGVGIGIKKNNQKLLNQINTAIDELKAEGTTSKLSIKWFGRDLSY